MLHISPKPLVALAVLMVLIGCGKDEPQTGSAEPLNENPFETLVTADWLSQHLNDPDLVVLDCTVRVDMDESGGFSMVSGRSDYEEGHIPTAGFADLMGDLSDGESPYRFAVPTPSAFAEAMGTLGVGNDSRVVLYDRDGSGWAARVWWMLRWVGFDRAALLDGGLNAWIEAGHPLSTEPATHTPKVLVPAPRPGLIADRDEVFAAMDEESVRLVDVMPEAHFRGEMSLYGRPGHIPGATNIPASDLLDELGRYLPPEGLAGLIGGIRDQRVIAYCGGGISASSAAFAMTRAGYTDVAVYTASLQEWAADPTNPLETEGR